MCTAVTKCVVGDDCDGSFVESHHSLRERTLEDLEEQYYYLNDNEGLTDDSEEQVDNPEGLIDDIEEQVNKEGLTDNSEEQVDDSGYHIDDKVDNECLIDESEEQMNKEGPIDDMVNNEGLTDKSEEQANNSGCQIDDTKVKAENESQMCDTKGEVDHVEEQTPRDYQLFLFECAKKMNVIAVAPTNSGKTLVAILLIRHINLITSISGKKYMFFLAPTVELVLQQYNYINKSCNIRSACLHGGINVDSWENENWDSVKENHELFVCTPEVLKNALTRGFIAINEISLTIIDECHHAVKMSSYNYIMCTFYKKCDKQTRPKIFGMTASPVIRTGYIERDLRMIEANLDSFIIYPSMVTPTQEIEIKFLRYFDTAIPEIVNELTRINTFGAVGDAENNPLIKTDTNLCQSDIVQKTITTSQSHLAEAISFIDSTSASRKIMNTYRYTESSMGKWCAECAAYSKILMIMESRSYLEDVARSTKGALGQNAPLYHYQGTEMSLSCDQVAEIPPSQVTKTPLGDVIQTTVATNTAKRPLKCIMDEWNESLTKAFDFNKMPSKIRVLVEYLEEAMCSEKRCIIFVQRVTTAIVLVRVLRSLDKFQGYNFESIFSQKRLHNNLELRRDIKALMSDVHVLISTKVCEEGIDISTCSTVIRFDKPDTFGCFIQSKGRLRSRDCSFVAMVKEGSIDENYYKDFIEAEAEMLKIMSKMDLNMFFEYSDQYVYSSDDIITIPSTGATVTIKNAYIILKNVCSALPSCTRENSLSTYVYTSRNSTFGCMIVLPYISGIEKQHFHSTMHSKKEDAKHRAALYAVGYLIQMGIINDRLRCSLTRKLPKERMVMDLDINLNYPVFAPKCLSELSHGQKLRVTLIEAVNVSSLGILMPHSLDLNNLCLEATLSESRVKIRYIHVGVLSFSKLQMDAIKKFHYTLFKHILRSKIEENMKWTLLVFPVSSVGRSKLGKVSNLQSIVNWSALSCFSNRTKPEKSYFLRKYKKMVFFDEIYYQRCYSVDRIDINGDASKHASKYHFMASQRDLEIDIVEKQPLLYAKPIPYIHQSGYNRERKNIKPVVLLSQFVKPIFISKSIIMDSLLMPLVLSALESRLKVLEFMQKFKRSDGEPYFDVDVLQNSLVAPVCRFPWDYQRLEFMGDSVIKSIQSAQLFSLFPTMDEGSLSLTRNNLENNDMLAEFGQIISLEYFLSFYAISRSTYIPPFVGRIIDASLTKGMIADSLEAVVGACDSFSPYCFSLELMSKMIKADKVIGEYCKLEEYYNKALEGYPNNESVSNCQEYFHVSEIEEILGYKFNVVSIALEALTHSTGLNMPTKRDYQRLEFLGDSVLGYIVARYLSNKYTQANPEMLTTVKGIFVGNKLLSIVALELKLHKCLDHSSILILGGILSVHEDIFDLKHTYANTENLQELWSSIQTQKVFADLYESLVGAIFLDSRFDLKYVSEFVVKTLIKPWEGLASTLGEMELKTNDAYERQLIDFRNKFCGYIDIVYSLKESEEREVSCSIIAHNVTIATKVASRKKASLKLASEEALRYIRNNGCICGIRI